MAEVLKKFGRYFLLDLIAQGGMAEIYRARLASADGAGRLIVIKRIQAGYGHNTEFLRMFRSEIKVTLGFNHPNIVQLYDFGEEQGQPYIAMELVDGKNLRQFMNRFNEAKKPFPVECAVYVIEQAANGLHYAHTFRDKITGTPLSIVHRDVSPQNILISYEGTVKVIDFGIAKATTNTESTRAGVIKGKPSYLSPEQISGEVLDGRSDIFALGIVLWELLVGRKLFSAASDLAVLKLIESSQTHIKPPSTQNPAVPKELDEIVMKTLAKQPEKRFQTAEELQRALHRFLNSFAPDFNPADLAYSARDFFKNEIVEDRKKIQRLNDEVEKLLVASELASNHHKRISEAEAEGTATARFDEGTKHTNRLKESPRPEKEKSLPGGSSYVEFPAVKPDSTNSLEFENSMKVEPKTPVPSQAAVALVPDKPAVSITTRTENHWEPKPQRSWLGTGAFAAAVVLIFAFVAPELGIRLPGGRGPQSVPGNNPIKATGAGETVLPDVNGKSIRLRLNITPPGVSTTASINGKPINLSNPIAVVPMDAPLELIVQNPSFKTIQRDFVVDSAQLGDLGEWDMDIQLEPSHYGFLSVRTTPSADATIMIDGKPWKRRTPFEKEKLPIGTYSVKLSNELLQMERTVQIEVKEGQVTQPYDSDREATRELMLDDLANRKVSGSGSN